MSLPMSCAGFPQLFSPPYPHGQHGTINVEHVHGSSAESEMYNGHGYRLGLCWLGNGQWAMGNLQERAVYHNETS